MAKGEREGKYERTLTFTKNDDAQIAIGTGFKNTKLEKTIRRRLALIGKQLFDAVVFNPDYSEGTCIDLELKFDVKLSVKGELNGTVPLVSGNAVATTVAVAADNIGCFENKEPVL